MLRLSFAALNVTGDLPGLILRGDASATSQGGHQTSQVDLAAPSAFIGIDPAKLPRIGFLASQ
jgi:hypothetical protein